MDAFDHIIKGQTTFPLCSILDMSFGPLLRTVDISLHGEKKNKEGIIYLDEKNTEPLLYSSCQVKFQIDQRF